MTEIREKIIFLFAEVDFYWQNILTLSTNFSFFEKKIWITSTIKKAEISINMWSLISAMLPCFIFLQRHIMASQSVELIKGTINDSVTMKCNGVENSSLNIVWLYENEIISQNCGRLSLHKRCHYHRESCFVVQTCRLFVWRNVCV